MFKEKFREKLRSVVEAGRYLDNKGWVPATSGNISVRISEDLIAITPSGKPKGSLSEEDLVLVGMDGSPVSGGKPSAETKLHLTVYRSFPQAGAVVHAHTPGSTVISRILEDKVVLENYELLKALEAIDTHQVKVEVPIFENDQDMERISLRLEAFFRENPTVRAFLLSSHGIYTWASSVERSLAQIEALEFLFECELRILNLRERVTWPLS